MMPRSEGAQLCHKFDIFVRPRAHISSYKDYLNNVVHHFDIPGNHLQFRLTAVSLVELKPFPTLADAVEMNTWQQLDTLAQEGDYWDFLQPSHFAHATSLLQSLASSLDISRQIDPLSALRKITAEIYQRFAYQPQSTHVDSPIDEALAARQGVCQDFTHIMIALARGLGIPCRYVSGYLYHEGSSQDRSAEDATHAWAEAFLPELGWIGFDPTNNLVAADRHIRVAIGRDYADVPPTRGVFKGTAEETMRVGVRVTLADAPVDEDNDILPEGTWEQISDLQMAQQQQ